MGNCSRIEDHRPAPEAENLAVHRLAALLFEVVPKKYATYCAVTSTVVAGVLRNLGFAAELAPCQLWHVTQSQNHVVGFVGKGSRPGRWDGHVVCITPSLLIDSALCNLERDFSLPVPWIAIAPRFIGPTQVMARLNLNTERRLWWHRAPDGVDTTVPSEPPDLIDGWVDRLVARINA
jgi:hypothetical protein